MEHTGAPPMIAQADSFVDTFRDEVAPYYRRWYCFIKIDPWEGGDFKLDRYFTSLTLHQEVEESGNPNEKGQTEQNKTGSNENEEKSTSYTRSIHLKEGHNGIFNVKVDNEYPRRIVVHGAAGMGKSTLCKKLAYDWATQSDISPLKDIPIVCVIELRKLIKSQSIFEAIKNQIISRRSALTAERIKNFCTDTSNISKVVLVLDGFDESGMNKDELIDLLKDIGDIRTLITTRSTHVEALQRYTLMTIDGFGEKGVDNYVGRYFEGDQDTVNRCLRKIKSNESMNNFAHVPLLLSMICYLSKSLYESKDKVETMASLFNTFLRALFENFLQKSTMTKQDLKRIWNALGKIALKSLLANNKKNIMSEEDFENSEDACKTGVQIGVIIKHRANSAKNDPFENTQVQYSFHHLLFQEKCAADYVSSHSDLITNCLQQIIDMSSAYSLKNFLAFIVGKESGDLNVRRIINRLKEIPLFHEIKYEEYRFTNYAMLSKSGMTDEGILKLQKERMIQYMFDASTAAVPMFKCCMFINYEKQKNGMLHEDIQFIMNRKDIESNTNDHSHLTLNISGIEYLYLIYFLQFAPTNMSFPKCFSKIHMHFSHVPHPISVSNLTQLMKSAFGSFGGLHFQDCTLEFTMENKFYVSFLSLSYSGPQIFRANLLDESDVTKLHMMGNDISPVSLPNMLHIISENFPLVKTCYVAGRIECHVTNPITCTMRSSNITRLELESITPIFLPNVLNVIGLYCPHMLGCELSSTSIDIHNDSDLQNMTTRRKTGLTKLSLKCTTTISLPNLLNVISECCLRLIEFKIDGDKIETHCDSELLNVIKTKRLIGLTQITVDSKKVILLPRLFNFIGLCCPNVKECHINSEMIDIPSHPSHQNMTNTLETKMPHLNTLMLKVNSSISFSNLLNVIVSQYPINLITCEIYGERIEGISHSANPGYKSLQNLHVMSDNPILLPDLFVLVDKCAPQIQHFDIDFRVLYTSPMGRLSRRDIGSSGYLMVTCNDVIEVPHLVHLIAATSPNIETCKISIAMAGTAKKTVINPKTVEMGRSSCSCLKYLRITSSMAVSLPDVLKVIGTHCSNLITCEVYVSDYLEIPRPSTTLLPITKLKELKVWSVTPNLFQNLFLMVSQYIPCMRQCRIEFKTCLNYGPMPSGLEQAFPEKGSLTVTGGKPISVAKLLRLIAMCCRNMENCVINDQIGNKVEEIDIQPMAMTACVEPSCLKELQVVRTNAVSLHDLFNAIGIYCPNMRTCEICCERIEIPNSNVSAKQLLLTELKVIVVNCNPLELKRLFSLVTSCLPDIVTFEIQRDTNANLVDDFTGKRQSKCYDLQLPGPSSEVSSPTITCTNVMPVLELLHVIAMYCPNMKTCVIIQDGKEDLSAEDNLQNEINENSESCLQSLDICSAAPVSQSELSRVTEMCFPKIQMCKVHNNVNTRRCLIENSGRRYMEGSVIFQSPIWFKI